MPGLSELGLTLVLSVVPQRQRVRFLDRRCGYAFRSRMEAMRGLWFDVLQETASSSSFIFLAHVVSEMLTLLNQGTHDGEADEGTAWVFLNGDVFGQHRRSPQHREARKLPPLLSRPHDP